MPIARARVSLIPAPDDPRITSGALQSTFGKFRQFLCVSGLNVSTPMFYDEADPAGGGYIGEFIVPLPHAIRPPLALVVSAWLQERPRRAVRLSVGESEAVAHSTPEAENFLKREQQLREAPGRADHDPHN